MQIGAGERAACLRRLKNTNERLLEPADITVHSQGGGMGIIPHTTGPGGVAQRWVNRGGWECIFMYPRMHVRRVCACVRQRVPLSLSLSPLGRRGGKEAGGGGPGKVQ